MLFLNFNPKTMLCCFFVTDIMLYLAEQKSSQVESLEKRDNQEEHHRFMYVCTGGAEKLDNVFSLSHTTRTCHHPMKWISFMAVKRDT